MATLATSADGKQTFEPAAECAALISRLPSSGGLHIHAEAKGLLLLGFVEAKRRFILGFVQAKGLLLLGFTFFLALFFQMFLRNL
jgi:hypothetical protein